MYVAGHDVGSRRADFREQAGRQDATSLTVLTQVLWRILTIAGRPAGRERIPPWPGKTS